MKCVILVGHGAAPSDCPAELIGELKRLEGVPGGRSSVRFAELDARIRAWPRTPQTDPYKTGLDEIAQVLGRALPGYRVITAYNEFCAPGLEEAFVEALKQGAREIVVATTMYTRGGVHSEKEIPQILKRLGQGHPEVSIRYAWPMNVESIGRFLAGEIERAGAR